MVVQTQHPIPVPFRDTTLYIIEFESNSYTPMKPIVEGMGLSWQGQHEKFSRDKVRWGIKEILIPSVDHKMRCASLCENSTAGL